MTGGRRMANAVIRSIWRSPFADRWIRCRWERKKSCFVHLKVPEGAHSSTQSLMIPSNTLLFRSEGLRVGVVRNGRAELVPITIGRDFGATVEVVQGLQSTDQVIVNPSDSLASGSPVQVSALQTGGAK